MDSDNNKSKLVSLESDWEQDALKIQQLPQWSKWLATGLTIVSCCLYLGVFSLISEYRLQVAENIRDHPIFTRIMLNIYQPFLVVFIIISLSLLVLLYLKIRKPRWSYRSILLLIIFNSLFAGVLLGVNFMKIN